VKVTLTPLKLMGLMAVWKARSPRIPQGALAQNGSTLVLPRRGSCRRDRWERRRRLDRHPDLVPRITDSAVILRLLGNSRQGVRANGLRVWPRWVSTRRSCYAFSPVKTRSSAALQQNDHFPRRKRTGKFSRNDGHPEGVVELLQIGRFWLESAQSTIHLVFPGQRPNCGLPARLQE
jgi:hypothetical protein